MIPILMGLTVILFVVADLVSQSRRARRGQLAVVPAQGTAGVADLLLPGLQPDRFLLPAGLFFHRGHTWANLLFSGQVKVGIDDFLQKLIGRVDGITLPAVGMEIKEGQAFAGIRQGGRTLTLTAPVDGTVCAVNGELLKAPGLLKRDPYTRGWLVAFQPKDLTGQIGRMMVGDRAIDWLRNELGRLHGFLGEILSVHRDALIGVTAADGGLVADGLLEHLDDETWAKFQARFLRS